MASRQGQVDELVKLLEVPGLAPWERSDILQYRQKQKGASQEVVRKGFEKTIEANPDNWTLRAKYVNYLEGLKDYASARAVIEPWLESHSRSQDIEYVIARAALARQLYLEGRYPEAWGAVEPVIDSQQAGAMQRGAMTLNKLGRREEAEELAKRALDRYPDGLFLRVMLAQFYWEWGRPQDAAALLKSGPYSPSLSDWQEIGLKFAETFKDRPKEEVLGAFMALLRQGMGAFELEPVTAAIATTRKDDCAFQMVNQLHWGGIGDLTFRIDGYKYLKALKGPGPALEWVRTAIPPSLYNPTTMMAYMADEYNLLWDLVDKPRPGHDEDFAWTMRAAASVKLGPGKDPHRAELVKYCREHPKGYWETISRYLVGLASEEELLAQAKSTQQRCENAYYLGLRAQSEGRLEDASDWYRISVESGLTNMGEYRWAHNQLYLWEGKGMSLSRLAAESRHSQ
jgi:tetratricopeptide (TPR) repeat protein